MSRHHVFPTKNASLKSTKIKAAKKQWGIVRMRMANWQQEWGGHGGADEGKDCERRVARGIGQRPAMQVL